MEPQQPSSPKPSWIYRHKLLAGTLAGALILLSAGLTNHAPNNAVVKGVTVTAAPTVTPTIIPTAIPTLAPTITPQPSPTPTATPTPTTFQSSQDAPAQQQGLSNNNYYENSSGNEVHSPAYSTDDSVPAGASAKCSDGTYSFSQHLSGTCSRHGGVAQWL